jgi:hypothetical protein
LFYGSIGLLGRFTRVPLVMTTGIVNLFGGITYEGGAIDSITAGLGEFLGYALRLLAGYAADRTGHYWLIT